MFNPGSVLRLDERPMERDAGRRGRDGGADGPPFNNLPVYSDGLRALRTVHLRAGEAKKMQDAFFPALRILEYWLAMMVGT